jgi:ribosomal protein S18 acetylase RimI-like enzyme
MDFLRELGPLAVVSRLRRLSERMTQDVVSLYKDLDIDFEPRWFPVFYLLSRKSSVGVVDAAKILGISHPAVNQIAGELIKQGLVVALKDKADKRKRLLALSPQGKTLLPVLEGIWENVHLAARELLDATGMDIMGMLDKLEDAVEAQGVYTRFVANQKQDQLAGIEIVEYQPEYRESFKRLNTEWIEQYFHLEAEDKKVLNNPEREILQGGGIIFFARNKASQSHFATDNAVGSILGTCALIPKAENTFELSKMAVTKEAQGRQIGKRLLTASIDRARELKANYLVLETNSKLTAAVNLYRKLGFILMPEVPGKISKYERADMRMRLEL